jgi:lipoyl(octanoyl) transferase
MAVPARDAARRCLWSWLGRIEYADGLALQAALAEERKSGRGSDRLLLLEHPHVYTLGRQSKVADLLWDEAERARRGVSIHAIDRGGEITYHGPGQLVGYPIIDLSAYGRDLHAYVRRLEETLIAALRGWGIAAERAPGYPGVWVGNDKIAAIGVHVSRWVTTHGFALNVDTDLAYFEGIVPCGLADRGVTSVRALCGRAPALAEAAADVAARFGEVFGAAMDVERLSGRR